MSTDTARHAPTPRRAALIKGALIATLIVTGPIAGLLVSVYAITGATLADFRPFLNDEVYYWHQIATAAAVGTGGGYYTVEELTPPVATFRFGPHGPVYPLIVGAAARLTGWHRASAPLFNVAWISMCVGAFCAMARPSSRRLWLFGGLVATFWPLSFWAASNMQESFHHGVAIALAGALVAAGRRARGALIVAWILLLVAMLVRPSWGVVLPALAVMSLRRPTPVRILIACVASAAALALVISTFTRIAAPLPGAFEFLKLARFEEGVAPIVSNASANLRRLATAGEDYDPLEIVHRVEYLAVTALMLAVTIARWRRLEERERIQLAAQASQLAGVVAAMIAFYALTNWTEHRVISAHLLLATAALAVTPGRFGPRVAAGLVLANVLALPVYAESFRQNRADNFVWDRRPLRVFEETIDGRLRYEPGLPPWCNTLLSAQYPPDLIAVPPGIGISVTRSPDELPTPPRSRFLLLDPPAYDAIAPRVRLEPIGAPLPYGTVYLNLDARCQR
jgi:hypothetical protein